MNGYRLPVAFPAHLEQAGQHFSSGVNSPGEVEGLMLSGRYVGITASEIREGLLAEIELYAGGNSKIFVDSGAFSEVRFGAAGIEVVKEITREEWLKRFAVYFRVAEAFRQNAYVVAPDRVGDQAVTLQRLGDFGGLVQQLALIGAQVIIPVQKGDRSMAEFWKLAGDAVQLPESHLIAGIPMKKDATTLAEIGAFVESLPWYGCRIHLLGLGPESKRFAPAVKLIKSIRPNCFITSDSVTIRRMVGRTNGRGGGPRALTAAQDRARSRGVTGRAIKSVALIEIGHAQNRTDAQEARRAGWFDTELESAPGVPLEPGCIEYGPGGPFGDEPVEAEQLSLLGVG